MTFDFDLEKYLTAGVEDIVKTALKAALFNPRESLFMAKYALASRKAAALRAKAKAEGEHIPPFLIASVTNRCNLHCAGCYARANNACRDEEAAGELTGAQWASVFEEAAALGVGFILLAGGEPLLRGDVLEAAAGQPDILFPVFTNATLVDEARAGFFDRHRNLVPVLSIEGGESETDGRRGAGIYQRLLQTMKLLEEKGILFGASVTVTRQNLLNVTSPEFAGLLAEKGCKVVFYVEYVPAADGTADLAPGEKDRALLMERLGDLRAEQEKLLFLAFPGDEKEAGGCLAAGRGFFHINAKGGAEPCPFSPYSDINVGTASLRQALRSELFIRLRSSEMLMQEHRGGCVLFENRQEVEGLLRG